MKKLTLLVVLALVLSLLAGCAGGETSPSAAPSSEPTQAPSAVPSAAPTAAPSTAPSADPTPSANLVKTEFAEYPVDADGVPTERVHYELPLCDDGLSFTYLGEMTTPTLAVYSNMAELPVWIAMKENTGVDMEFVMTTSTNRATVYATRVASDDLPDVVATAGLTLTMTESEALDDDYIINLLDYIEYLPNYMLTVHETLGENYGKVYLDKDRMSSIHSLMSASFPDKGMIIRGDWLEKIGKTTADVADYDGLHDVLSAWKTELGIQWPLLLWYNFDCGNCMSAGFNTYGGCTLGRFPNKIDPVVVDGEVQFTYLLDSTKAYVDMMSGWFTEGLVNPDYNSFTGMSKCTTPIVSGVSGMINGTIDYITTYKSLCEDPDAQFVTIPTFKQVDGGKHHLVEYSATNSKAVSISAKCKNIPLLLTWCDYIYSDEAYDIVNYGEEGVTFTRDGSGRAIFTDLISQNPDGLEMRSTLEIYCMNGGMGRYDAYRKYYYEGSEEMREMLKAWSETDGDDAYAFPDGIQLTDEESNDLAAIWGDISTYIVEQYFMFASGEKSMDEWDAYAQSVKAMGYDDAEAVYQSAYDRYTEI